MTKTSFFYSDCESNMPIFLNGGTLNFSSCLVQEQVNPSEQFSDLFHVQGNPTNMTVGEWFKMSSSGIC